MVYSNTCFVPRTVIYLSILLRLVRASYIDNFLPCRPA